MLPMHSDISGKYFSNVIRSPFFWGMIESNLKGIAYKGLNLNILREFVIPLPSFEEQQRIVAKVDELIALCDQLKSRLQTSQQTQLALAESLVEGALA